jgi:stearoyl-CoA desaturase (delta-9 desaturase)
MSTVLERPAVATPEAPQTDKPSIPGVYQLPDKTARLQKRLVLIVTIIPFLGFIAAVWGLWGTGFTTTDAALFAGFYLFTGFGVTVGFHRLFTHQSFETKPWVRNMLAIAGSMAIQGPVIRWVADHRRHHAFSDQPGDPHSPHLDEGPGLKGVLNGLWHAHIGWFFDDEQTSARRWAPDLVKEASMRKIDRLFPLWVLISFAGPAVLGFAITGTFAGALSAFLWAGLVRIFMLHHVTWSINSICHFYGSRPYETTDHSTNNWVLAIISMGESWHNLHHAEPTAARHGVMRGQLDSTARIIWAMEKLRLATEVRWPTRERLDAKLVSNPG